MVEVVWMLSPMPADLAGLVAAVKARFAASRQLTSWDAVEQVLNEVPVRQLTAIYRKASATHGWCGEALSGGDEFLVPIGVEYIGLMLRRDPRLQQEDDRRSRGSIRPRRPAKVVPEARRRPGRH